ncbi:protein with Dpy-30 motif [Klebsormidium nitens]|uniref:Protein with Dpy-30 motif n=1 Tax=Klebsormidium nitens TaxID=105231 RepID=A0A1Y1IJ10_KLENI|nr:protein with Dpy-30 motif [Klebsormidium nitens]|eukprot:GAQ88696.1 protein with Dpy-30 motif [Klebsormidium nitens]
MADDAPPAHAEEPVSMEAPNESAAPHEGAASAGSETKQEGGEAKAESGSVQSEETSLEQQAEKAPVTENAVADAIAAATPRGEKPLTEAKAEELAAKEAEIAEPAAETKKVIKEEKTAPLEELAPALDQKLSLKVEKPASQPSSPSAGENILPTSPQIRAITGNDSALPVKEYLNSTIVPVLRDALRALVKTRPEDPYEFVAKYLVEHKPRK